MLENCQQQLSSIAPLRTESSQSLSWVSEKLTPFRRGQLHDKVLSVRQELIRADRNLCRKTGNNHLEYRKQSDCSTSKSCSFLYRSQNRTRSVPLESKQCRLSIKTSFDHILALEGPQPSIQKRVLKGPKTCQNLVEIEQNALSN